MPTTTEPDTITQLQTCLDQLATQLYASLSYVSTRHPAQPSSASAAIVLAGNNETAAKLVASGAGALSSNLASQPAGQTGSSNPTQSNPTQPSATPGDPSADTGGGGSGGGAAASAAALAAAADAAANEPPLSPSHNPLTSTAFEADLQELAEDLVAKQRQIEGLVAKLPSDLEAARRGQDVRLVKVESRVRELEGGARGLAERRERALGRIEEVVGAFRRV